MFVLFCVYCGSRNTDFEVGKLTKELLGTALILKYIE